MKCYIRNVLLINTSITNGNIDCNCLEAVVKNYPKHERALVYVKEDDSCIQTLIGNVERIYIINNCLFGDISFTKSWTFIINNLVYKPFPLATISGVIDMPEFSHLDKIEFIDNESDACSEAIDLSKICGEQEYAYWMFNRPHYDSAQEATQPETGALFKKKYDNEKSGFIGHVMSNGSETLTMQEAPFIHASNLTRSELINWLNSVLSALYTERSYYASQMADIEKKKKDINNDFNERMETLKKAFPQLDPGSILSQDRKGVLI